MAVFPVDQRSVTELPYAHAETLFCIFEYCIQCVVCNAALKCVLENRRHVSHSTSGVWANCLATTLSVILKRRHVTHSTSGVWRPLRGTTKYVQGFYHQWTLKSSCRALLQISRLKLPTHEYQLPVAFLRATLCIFFCHFVVLRSTLRNFFFVLVE